MVTAARKYLTENLFLQAPPPSLPLSCFARPNNNGAWRAKKCCRYGWKKNKSENLLKFNFHLRIISAFPDSELV